MQTPFSMAYSSLSHLQDLITMHLFLASICQRQIGRKYKNKIINGCFILNIHHHKLYSIFFLSPCNYNITSSLILLLFCILLNWFSDIGQQYVYIIILFTLIVFFMFSVHYAKLKPVCDKHAWRTQSFFKVHCQRYMFSCVT